MNDFPAGLFIGAGLTLVILLVIMVNFGVIKKSDDLRQECEKDLARNLKCEMVYVKPKDI